MNLFNYLNEKYKYWAKENDYIIKKGKKSRYNFRKPYNFILDCSIGVRNRVIKGKYELTDKEKEKLWYNLY